MHIVHCFDESCLSWVLRQPSVCCRPVWNSPSQSLCVPSRPSRGPCIMKLCVVLWFWTHIRQHLYVRLHMPEDAVLTTSYFQPRWDGLQPNAYTNKHSQQQFKKRDGCHGAGCLITEGKWAFFSESLMPATSSCGLEVRAFFFFFYVFKEFSCQVLMRSLQCVGLRVTSSWSVLSDGGYWEQFFHLGLMVITYHQPPCGQNGVLSAQVAAHLRLRS